MNYTGKMKVLYNDRKRGQQAFGFILGGKEFTAYRADIRRKLQRLVGVEITLSTVGDDSFSNNEDHRFIEGMRSVKPRHYKIELGS